MASYVVKKEYSIGSNKPTYNLYDNNGYLIDYAYDYNEVLRMLERNDIPLSKVEFKESR